MANFREEILLETRGETQVIDITSEVAAVASRAGITEGLVNVFAPGATAGISTIEHEPGCIRDLQEALERVAPREGFYHHNERWGDGNGFSHVRAALMGPSLTVPWSGCCRSGGMSSKQASPYISGPIGPIAWHTLLAGASDFWTSI